MDHRWNFLEMSFWKNYSLKSLSLKERKRSFVFLLIGCYNLYEWAPLAIFFRLLLRSFSKLGELRKMNPPFRFRTSSAPPPPSKLSLAKNVRQQLQHQQQPQKKEEERSFNQRSPHHSEAEKKKAVVNVRAPSPGIIFSPPTFDLSKEGRFAYGMARGSLPMIPALSAANVRPQGIINLQTSLGFKKATQTDDQQQQDPSPPSPEVSSNENALRGGDSPHRSHYQQKHQYFTLRRPSATFRPPPPPPVQSIKAVTAPEITIAPAITRAPAITIAPATLIKAPSMAQIASKSTPTSSWSAPAAAAPQLPPPPPIPPPPPPKTLTFKKEVIPWISDQKSSASNSKVKKERNQIITAGISSSNDNSANKRPFKRPLFPESTTAINKSNSSSTKKRKEPVIKIGKYDMLGQLGCPNTSTNSLPLLFNHKKPFKSSPVKDIDPADLLELDEKFFID